jgi:hypothetical protein
MHTIVATRKVARTLKAATGALVKQDINWMMIRGHAKV